MCIGPECADDDEEEVSMRVKREAIEEEKEDGDLTMCVGPECVVHEEEDERAMCVGPECADDGEVRHGIQRCIKHKNG